MGAGRGRSAECVRVKRKGTVQGHRGVGGVDGWRKAAAVREPSQPAGLINTLLASEVHTTWGPADRGSAGLAVGRCRGCQCCRCS